MNAPAGNTLTVLEGHALELKHPDKINITGDIDSVLNFLKKRYSEGLSGKKLQFVDKETSIVIANDEAMMITLYLDKNDPFGTEITGKLEFTPELKVWNVNPANTTFKREEVVKLVRFGRRFFDDVEIYDKVLSAFQAFKISTQADISAGSDTRGNKSAAFEKRVLNENNMPTGFYLNLPIFKGQQTERFLVDICMDTTESIVKFWFESPALLELIDDRKKELFAKQLAGCTDFVIINK